MVKIYDPTYFLPMDFNLTVILATSTYCILVLKWNEIPIVYNKISLVLLIQTRNLLSFGH